VIKYLKAAFLNRWNLLALVGGAGFAALSGHPDIAFPLLLAGELGYLTFLGTNGTFQKYVDTEEHRATRGDQSRTQEQAVARIMASLPKASLARFNRLRDCCYELQRIAEDLKQSGPSPMGGTLKSLQWEGFDRLLWVFLRLLFTHQALSQFLDRTDAEVIAKDAKKVEDRLASLEEDDGEHTAKMRRALEDNLNTSRERLANYKKAEANHEFVELEIDRLDNKIRSLAELAVNRQEHDFITSQVDAVANSMVETERTMNELDFATGLAQYNTETPQLLPQPIKILE